MQKIDESEHEINSQQSCFQLYFKTERSWFFHGERTSQYIITFHQADSSVHTPL